jgi:hypothetical protein
MRPRYLLSFMLALAVLQVALVVMGWSGSGLPWGGPAALVRMVGKVAAYSLALMACRHIANEYGRRSWFRAAWLLLFACAAVSIFRYLFDNQVLEAFWRGYWRGQAITVLREVPSAFSLLLLAAGVLAMAGAILKTNLGFSLRRMDYLAIAAAMTFLVLALILREDISAVSRLQSAWTRGAQLTSHISLAIAAAGAIVLLRFSRQMGGGQLALAMGWLIAHIATRCLLIAVGPFESHLTLVPHLKMLEAALYDSTPWMFAVSAAYRMELMAHATEQAAGWGIAGPRVPDSRVA